MLKIGSQILTQALVISLLVHLLKTGTVQLIDVKVLEVTLQRLKLRKS